MTTFEWTIGLLLGAVVLSALARQLKVPYPTFLAIGGALLAFVPASPSWTLEPKLALFVAPVLLGAAFDTSLRDLRNNWLPVSTLVVVAVGFTTRAIAYRAAFEEIEGDRSEAAEILRIEYRALLRQTKSTPHGGIATGEMPADPLRRRGIAAAQGALLRLRQSEAIGDDAFRQLEEELDRAELSAQS